MKTSSYKKTGHYKRSVPRIGLDTVLTFLLTKCTLLSRAFFSIDGFLFPQEGAFLHKISKKSPLEGPVIEIGSMNGLSTVCIAAGLNSRSRDEQLYSIDPHLYGTEKNLKRNLEKFKVSDRVEILTSKSSEIVKNWNNPQPRMVFIDGSHQVLDVMEDYLTWLSKLKPGGFILLHDSTDLSSLPGPHFVAKTRILNDGNFEARGSIGSITWAKKRGGNDHWSPKVFGAAVTDCMFSMLKRWVKSDVTQKKS
ncbi:putative secreted protein [Chitinispirillum alkaliphilum]|nr:putative secreted protein [Chitinispirillum alkaliphilum]